MSEDEKKGAALKTVAALAAIAAPPVDPPSQDFKDDKIEQLQALFDEEVKENNRLQKRVSDIASDREKCKLRAEKAEAASDGLALERATKERDGLRTEVSKLTKRITESDKEKNTEIAQLKATLKRSMADANEAASHAERLQTTMGQAIKARDRAFEDRDTASAERIEAIKRVADLEGQIRELKDKLKPATTAKPGLAPPVQTKPTTGAKLQDKLVKAPAGGTIDMR